MRWSRAARARAAELDADCYVTIGGGTTTGTGKAIALETGLPVLAVPTTYAGSEMTPIYGITEGGVKKTGRDRPVLPRAVIYDPALTLSLPPGLRVPLGSMRWRTASQGSTRSMAIRSSR